MNSSHFPEASEISISPDASFFSSIQKRRPSMATIDTIRHTKAGGAFHYLAATILAVAILPNAWMAGFATMAVAKLPLHPAGSVMDEYQSPRKAMTWTCKPISRPGKIAFGVECRMERDSRFNPLWVARMPPTRKVPWMESAR